MLKYAIAAIVLLSACALPVAAWELENTMVSSFFDVFFYANTNTNPGPAFQVRLVASGPAATQVSGPDAAGVYDTEMLSMSLTGAGSVRIRESPTMASSGKRWIEPGTTHIDSFFDVFTELSIDGGQTWIGQGSPAHYSGQTDSFFDITYRIDVATLPIYLYQGGIGVGELRGSEIRLTTPEPTSLLALTVGLAGLGGTILRRRR